jgi:hypothetical protein
VIRSHAEITWKMNAITNTLQVVDEHFTSSVEPARAKRWEVIAIACLYLMSSMTEALISEVFKRPVLWDHKIKNYNRDFVDKEWRHLSDNEYQQ